MSTAVMFDTLKFVETLKASGFDETQAKGMVVAIKEVQDAHLDELATKRDIKEMELKLENRLAETKVEIARLQADIAPMKWMMAVIVAGIVALVLKAFFPVG